MSDENSKQVCFFSFFSPSDASSEWWEGEGQHQQEEEQEGVRKEVIHASSLGWYLQSAPASQCEGPG